MNLGHETLARSYARAFFEVLREEKGMKEVERLKEQLQEVVSLAHGFSKDFFQNPVFDSKEKQKIIESLFQSRSFDPSLLRFAQILLFQKQLTLLPEIAQGFEEELRTQRNEVVAFIRTAFPLLETEEKEILQNLETMTHKKVIPQVDVDPSLIGGVHIRVGSQVFDHSILGYLSRLQEGTLR